MIIGATSIVGQSIAETFAKKNYNLILWGRSKKILNVQKRNQIFNKVNTRFEEINLNDHVSIEKKINLYKKINIIPDYLILAAAKSSEKFLLETSIEEINESVNVNLGSALLIIRMIVPEMIKKNFGRIMFFSSNHSYIPLPGFSLYSSSKRFMDNFCIAISQELNHKNNIRIFSYKPNPMPRWDRSSSEQHTKNLEMLNLHIEEILANGESKKNLFLNFIYFILHIPVMYKILLFLSNRKK